MKVKEESEKVGLKLNIQKTKIMASHPISSVQSLTRVRLCDPMNHSTPGLPVHHQLPEFTQTHVHRVSDAIQPSRPLLSPSPPAPNPSHHFMANRWENNRNSDRLFSWPPKSLQMVTAAMKLKDTCSLEEKL